MRFVKWASAAALAVFISASAQGALLVSDSFPYADGNLVGQTPTVGGTWAAHSGAGNLPVQVSSGQIVLQQGSGSREDVNSSFDGGWTAGTSGNVVYSSFDLSVPDPSATISSTYFAHFLQGTSTFASRLWVTTPTSSGYRIALTNGSSLSPATGAPAYSSDLAFGTTYTVVTSYDYSTMTGQLWIDPTLASHPSLDATDPGFADAVTAYAFRQSSGNTIENIDNLKVGTTFYDVTGIPEPSSLCLLGLGGLALMGRKRRNAAIA